MKFYISPERREELERKLQKMFKYLEHKPEVKIGNAEQVVQEFIDDYGEEGYDRRTYKIQACLVEIEDIKTENWVLVATVAYDLGSLLMCDARYFKNIPEKYGLQYSKCDHCGGEHKNRKESHILYNPTTDTWMQVGSSCVNKMINGGKYLNGLMVKLYNVIKCCGGCDDDEWFGGGWRPSNKYKMEAVRLDEAMMVCEEYKKEKGNDLWVKPEYNERGWKQSDGTNDGLMHLFLKLRNDGNFPAVDSEFVSEIKDYFDTIPYGDFDYDLEYGGYEKTLTQKIKDAFEEEYILLCEMYLAWFAIANYKDSFAKADFESAIAEKGFEKGMKINIANATLLSSTFIVPEPEYGYYGVFQDRPYYDNIFEYEGIRFSKHTSHDDVIDAYKNEDGTYSFCATIKYIAFKKKQVVLGGRLSKIKK